MRFVRTHQIKWSLKLGRVAGINVYRHWTFLLPDGRLVGLLTLEDAGEMVMVSEAASKFEHKSWNQWWGKENKS